VSNILVSLYPPGPIATICGVPAILSPYKS
jgi:hypothetical protein